MTSEKKFRNEYIDILKGLAAYMIVLYHFTEYGFVDFGFRTGEPYFPMMSKILLGICAAGVPIFFWTNGITTIDKNYSLRKAGLRLFNIAKVYFLWGTMGYLILSQSRVTFANIGAGLIHNVYYFWFFKTLGLLVVIQWVYAKIGRPKWLMLAGWTMLFVFPFITNTVFDIVRFIKPEYPQPAWAHTGVFTLYSLVYFFGCKIITRENPLWINVALIIAGAVLNAFVVWVNARGAKIIPDNVNGMFPSLGALMMTVGIIQIIRKYHGFPGKLVISWFGRNCLGIYIFHVPMIFLFRRMYDGTMPMTAAVGISILILIVAASLTEAIQRTPFVRQLIKI